MLLSRRYLVGTRQRLYSSCVSVFVFVLLSCTSLTRLTQRRCKVSPAAPRALSTNDHEVHFILLRDGAGGRASGLRLHGPDHGLPRRIVWFGEARRRAGARQRQPGGVPDGSRRPRAFHRRQLEDEPPGPGLRQGPGQTGLHAICLVYRATALRGASIPSTQTLAVSCFLV